MRALGLALLTLLVVACHFDSPVFTPDPKNPAYHCHASDGSVIADGVWCYPVDGTHTCCPADHQCSRLAGEQSCEYIGRPDQPTFAARKPVNRTPESP